MGQFLTTSLITKFSTNKDNIGNYKANGELEIQKLFINSDLDLFDIHQNDTAIIYEVKKEFLKVELLEFLNEFYKDLYAYSDSYTYVLNDLKRLSDPEKWLSLAEEKEHEEFQTDDSGYDFFYTSRGRIGIRYSSIILAMEGKISMETYGEQFAFFESLIKKVYSKYKLSNLIKISITE